MGTPPEDESGAGEGAPIAAADPAKSERASALAARIDAFMGDAGEDEDPGEAAVARERFASEPGIPTDDAAPKPEPRSSEGTIDVRPAGDRPEPSTEAGIVEVDLEEIKPRTSEGMIVVRADDAKPEPIAGEDSIVVNFGGNTPPPRESGSIDVDLRQSEPAIPRPRASVEPGVQPIEPSVQPIEPGVQPSVEPDVEVVDELEEISGVTVLPPTPVPPPIRPPAIPPPRPPGAPPPPPKVAIPAPRIPPIRPPAIPAPRQTVIGMPTLPVPARPLAAPQPGGTPPPVLSRTKTDDRPAPPPAPRGGAIDRVPRPAGAGDSQPKVSLDDVLAGSPDITRMEGGVEVGTATPNVVVDQPLEAHLESPTVIDKAVAALGETGSDARAEALARDLEAKVLADPESAAYLAYELGELYERRLADEAKAVKAFGRSLNLDASLRPNLWAIRRVFYRRALWPNLQKLVDAEVQYARDDHERADLLLEKARVSAHRLADTGEARRALDEAARIAPQHQGVLLELERLIARSGDVPALLDVWDRLAEAVEQPARKIAYLLEVGRTAGAGGELQRAHDAFDKAATIASASGNTHAAERIARERLRIAEDHGTPEDVLAASETLATVLLAAFGPAGPASESAVQPTGERPTRATALRLELVALRRRQAELARDDQPDRSWEYLQQALALSPGEPIVLADLTELAEELGRYDDLAELVQNWQAVEGDPARAMSLSIRRADALLRGGQRDQARALVASLEATAPGFIVLTSVAERDALARQDPASLAATYLAAAHAALLGTWLGPGLPPRPDVQAAATLYVQGAELLAYEVGTAEAHAEARVALGKALEAIPEHPAALEALTELDDMTGNVAEALARLRGLANVSDDGGAKRIYLDRAIRLARSHGDLDTVLELEREVVAAAPADIPARWRLESTLAQLGRDDERAELLGRIAGDETDATGRGTALLAAARLRERGGAVEAATELYRQVLALWPDDAFARESLLDLLRAQERWQELVAERRAEAKSLPDGPAARRAMREAAWILEVRLDDAVQAAQVYDDWLARVPDDRAALEGIARCRAGFGDRNGEVAALGAIAESEQTVDAAWLYARALERAGRYDDAADEYRALIGTEEVSAATTNAALALGDIAAARADTVMRVEATAALAGRTADPRLGAALAEDSGWMYALALEDFDRAAQSFEAAIALDPTRRGAHLGAGLVAARRGVTAELAQAYEGLAATVQMPEASAALLLRGAAVAAAANDLDVANQRVAAARQAAPDDTSALLVAAETAPQPTVTQADAFAAVDPLLARAEVLEMRSALADDAAARASWELDRAEALELAGRMREAGSVVAAVLKSRPDDLRALSALRRMAKRAGDKSTAASAAYALARVLGDRSARLELLREAAAVFDGPGLPHNNDYAIAAYRRILANEPGATEFDRVLELLRERGDVRTLIATLTGRISHYESDGNVDDTVPMLLERATVLHGLGDTEIAIVDLDVLLERAPNHVEALRFRADLAFNSGDVQSAVAMWRRYLIAETRPHRKSEIELQLAQVLAENTDDIGGAIEQLERVVDAKPDDVQLRERLLALCMRANDWERAARELRTLARTRPTPQEKAREELRLGLMLRDRLGDRTSARLALDRARTLDPLNLDVVRELADVLDPSSRAQMLAVTARDFREAIAQTPGRGALYEKLAQVNAWQADVDARWISLVAVEAVGTTTVDQKQVLQQGRQRLVAPSRVRLDDAARNTLRGWLEGPLHDLWRTIAPAVQVATGVDVAKLGFARGDKVALKKLGDRYEPLATALACFGVDDVELYINADRGGFARALAADTPILCLGSDVAAANTSHNRFLLGRAVATVAEGVATLPELRDGELAWTVAAALKAVEVAVPAPLQELVIGEDAGIADRAKLLKKELGRKARAVVQQLAHSKGGQLGAIDEFKRAALAVGHRAGLLWASDLAVALAILDVGKGGRALADSPAALELTAWSVAEAHLHLRERLQLALKVHQ